MARKREQDEFIISSYFHYTDAAEQATVSEEGAFEIPDAANIGRKARGRSFESPTLPAPLRSVPSPGSQAPPPAARQQAVPTPAGSAAKGIAGAVVQRGPGSTSAPSGGAAGGGVAGQPGGYQPPIQVQPTVRKGGARR